MKAIIVLLFFMFPFIVEGSEVTLPGGKCLECHTRIQDKIAQLWKEDIHAMAGIDCSTCHGGDPTVDDNIKAKSKALRFKGKITALQIPELCGSCHSNAEYMKQHNPMLPVDQLQKYQTSQHGKQLAKGDAKVAQCASCHGAHGIRKINDAKSPTYATNLPKMCARCHADTDYMAKYYISTRQYGDYVESVHGKALLEKGDIQGSPACNDCHGNHGAVPPGVSAISNICGKCHSYNAELFLKSPMAKPFEEKSLSDCIACHGKHRIIHVSDDWIGNEPGTVCRNCHTKEEKGARLANYFQGVLTKVKKDFEETKTILKLAENQGMDVTEGEDHLQNARQSLIQMRTIIHAFSKPLIQEKLVELEKSQKAAMQVAQSALQENKNRRLGLAMSTVFLLFLTLGVAMKIRSLPPID